MKDYVMIVIFSAMFGANCFYMETLRIAGEFEQLGFVIFCEILVFSLAVLTGYLITLEKN